MTFSTTPLLLALQLGFVITAMHRARRAGAIEDGHVHSIYTLTGAFLLWIAATSYFALSGVYDSPAFLALLPGLWIFLIPAVITGGAFALSRNLRQAIGEAPAHVPPHWFVLIHAARIAALGTAYKTIRGEFPLAFELALGIGDLAFGLSALYVARRVAGGLMGWRALMKWQLIGAAVILVPGSVMAQLGLPGPLYIFTRLPNNTAIFDFPMVLAPTFIVPTFVAFNIWHAWYLWSRRPELRNAEATEHAGRPTLTAA